MNNTPLVGDNDHGDTVPTPPQEVLRNITQERDALYANTILLLERIAQLERERDAARQDLCYIEAADRSTGDDAVPYTDSLPKDIAEEWGWDCFKENTNV